MQKEILNYFYNYYVKEFFLEIVSPAHCVVCGKKLFDSNFICESCKNKIIFNEYPLISREEVVYYYGMTRYTGVMEELIKKFKFNGYKALSKFLSSIIINFIKTNNIEFDFIGFVPMSKMEFKERGYNQTYLLAKDVSFATQKPIIRSIYKIKETKKQTNLSKNERLQNLKDAFVIKEAIMGNILIIDDVYTTGTTAKEITHAFKKVLKNGNIYFIALSQTFN
ncbi:MAG: ComF family protein [Caldisericum sp.]|uniref:ComF family protein n=1 Tax=Caldisericum exile TaxID=693075 RepID=UPI003C74D2C0